MQRLFFILAILVLASLVASCAPSAVAQPEQVKALENSIPTDLPEKSAPVDSATSAIPSKDPPADCPVTVTGILSFEAPAPYSPSAPWPNQFWFGSENLWTTLPTNGVWSGLPDNPEGYTQKIFWWRDGYVWNEEPEPNLTVTGKRLDASAPPLNVSRATNAYASDIGSAMLVGVDFPTLGCWKITGKYKGAELSFVIWVAP